MLQCTIRNTKLTAVPFIRYVVAIIEAIADPPWWDTAACVSAMEVVVMARCTGTMKTSENLCNIFLFPYVKLSGIKNNGMHPQKVYSQTAEVYNKSNKTKLKSEKLNNIHITNNTVSKFHSQAAYEQYIIFALLSHGLTFAKSYAFLYSSERTKTSRTNETTSFLETPQATLSET